jgi:hypothetical protein
MICKGIALPADTKKRSFKFASEVMMLSSSLNAANLPTILRWCKNSKGTGILMARNNAIMKRIFVEKGRIISAASNDPREYLGQFLIAFGKMDERQLQQAFEIQKRTHVLLGKVAVSAGMVSQKDLEKVLEYKIVETIFDLFLWHGGKYLFQSGAFPKKDLRIQVSLDIDLCLKEGLRRVRQWKYYREVFPHDNVVLTLGDQKLPTWEQNPRLRRIFILLESGITLKAMCRELKGPTFPIVSRLFELHQGGYLRVQKETQEGRRPPQQGSPFENRVSG